MIPLAGVGIIQDTSSEVAPDDTIVSPRGALGAVGAMEVYITLNLLYRTPTKAVRMENGALLVF